MDWDRRSLLGAIGTGTVGALAGCAGLFDSKTPRKPTDNEPPSGSTQRYPGPTTTQIGTAQQTPVALSTNGADIDPLRPEFTVENSLSYSEHGIGESLPVWKDSITLITSQEEADQIDQSGYNEEWVTPLQEVDFDARYVVLSTLLMHPHRYEVIGIEQESDSAIQIHLCTDWVGANERGPRRWFVAVERTGDMPETVRITRYDHDGDVVGEISGPNVPISTLTN